MVAFGASLALSARELKAQRLYTDASPQTIFALIEREFENAYLLESASGETRLAEYSFLGFDPVKLVKVKDNVMETVDRDTGERERAKIDDPLDAMRDLVLQKPVKGPFRFIGGAVGYISYDAVRYWERLRSKAKDDLVMPEMEFGIYPDGIVFDHHKGEIHYYTLGENRLSQITSLLKDRPEKGHLTSKSPPKPSMSKARFEEIIRRAKEYIKAGDIFQVVLSKRYDFELIGDLTRFYSALSSINPSPYMYFVRFGPRKVIGSSPEMLARVEGDRLETFPIAGTRPRLANKRENARLTKEMLSDPKERAEHVMLVDLARNDVGRVSNYGSVRVPELLTVQQFSHVQHIVSHVVGSIRQGLDSFDAMRAIFPAGTVSGAPKPRAMEIIDELEAVKRGPYAGALGYFSFNGNADFAITIRTLVANGSRCSIQSGAGIVADSDPEKEWHESESKAAGLLKAVEAATAD